MNEWPTKEKDIQIAQVIMEEYANKHDSSSLGLFELVVNLTEKQMNFRLSHWVVAIAQHFCMVYGANHGDFVTRQVISRCIVQGHTIH